MRIIQVYLTAMTVAAIALVSAHGHAQTISEDEYRETVFVLFDEFMQMKKDGVFLDAETVELLMKAKHKFPNTIRGDNLPGGFFARPPGSDWLKRVQALRETGHKFVCFDIPEMPSGTGICGHDLMQLYMGIGSPNDVSFLDAVAGRFWLAAICHKNPGACAPSSTEAPAPEDCRSLLLAAGKTSGGMVRKGNETQTIAMDGLDRGRRVNVDDYGLLADRVFQLLGWQADMVTKLEEAISCMDKRP